MFWPENSGEPFPLFNQHENQIAIIAFAQSRKWISGKSDCRKRQNFRKCVLAETEFLARPGSIDPASCPALVLFYGLPAGVNWERADFHFPVQSPIDRAASLAPQHGECAHNTDRDAAAPTRMHTQISCAGPGDKARYQNKVRTSGSCDAGAENKKNWDFPRFRPGVGEMFCRRAAPDWLRFSDRWFLQTPPPPLKRLSSPVVNDQWLSLSTHRRA